VEEPVKKSYAIRGALFLLLSLSWVTITHADTIDLASSGTAADPGQFNTDGATIAIAPNLDWAAPLSGSSWVSFGSTGDVSTPGFFVVPNGTVVTFSDVFNITGTPTGGVIEVMADDSAAVILNGVTLEAQAPTVGNTYATCSDFGIGCIVASTIILPASVLQPGTNTLEFQVEQQNGSSFGLDYSGYVTDPVSTPEPNSAMLLGLGLLSMTMGGAATGVRRWGSSLLNQQ